MKKEPVEDLMVRVFEALEGWKGYKPVRSRFSNVDEGLIENKDGYEVINVSMVFRPWKDSEIN